MASGLGRAYGCLIGLTLLLPGPALAATGQGEVRVAAGGGYDSNPDRALDGAARGDGLVEALGDAEGSVSFDALPVALTGRYDLGAKHYLTLNQDDVVAQSASGEGSYLLGTSTLLGLTARGKDRETRSGARDYTDLASALFVQTRWSRLILELDAGAERFIYKPDASYSYGGPQATLTATVPIERRHQVHASLSATRELFDGMALDVDGVPTGERQDWLTGASVGYAYRGPVRVTVDYAFTNDGSNSYGQSSQRHRLTAAVAALLPWHVVLSGNGALQYTHFPQGIAVSPEILLLNESENTDELALKLSRAWELGPEVELEGATYRSDFATNGLLFHRSFVQATVGWRF